MASYIRARLETCADYAREHRVLVTLTSLFFAFSLVRFLRKIGDFEVYYAAAWRYLHGFSIHLYEPNMFTYPTAAAMLHAPLTLFGYTGAKVIFFLLVFGCLLMGIHLTNTLLLGDGDVPPRTRRIVFIAALICTSRYFLAVLDNQQTDLFIFGLVTLGIYLYQRQRGGASAAWAVPVLLKANPMFMVLLPVFQKRARVAIGMIALVAAAMILPDLLKPAPGENVHSTLTLPAHVIPRDGIIGEKEFVLVPAENSTTAFLDEYLSLTIANEGPSWWEDLSNPQNQSLTRILLYHTPPGLDARMVFLVLCLAFGGALFPLARASTGGPQLAITGILFYAAFVLIGPVSSKPHFVMLYGLFTYAWYDLSRRFSYGKLATLLLVGAVLGFSSSGFLSEFSDRLAVLGHIGLTSLVLWLYVYITALKLQSRQRG